MAKKEILNNDALTVRVGEGVVDAVKAPVETVHDVVGASLDLAESALDIIENQTERVVTVTKNNPFLIGGALLLGVGIGAFVAYKITRRRLSEEFDEELRVQIAEAKAFHRRMIKEGEFESPESAVKALVPDEVVDAVRSYQGRERPVPYDKPDKIVDPRPPAEEVVETTVTERTVSRNVFKDSAESKPPDWDYNAELADRELHPDQPYAISFEEFNENALNHEQTTLAYFTEDDVLVDAMDKPIDNVEYTVGSDNLSRFGHGSGDPNVVYVRNEKTDMDFEIVRNMGSYQREVFGSEPELKHSRRRPDRRSWRADE